MSHAEFNSWLYGCKWVADRQGTALLALIVESCTRDAFLFATHGGQPE